MTPTSLDSIPITVYANSFEISKIPTQVYHQIYVEFRPKPEEVHRRRLLIHHLQNVVAPEVFHRRLVYDGDSIAYSPGQLPSLAGHGSGKFVINLDSTTQVSVNSKGCYQICLTPTAGDPIKPSDVNSLILGGQATSSATTATALMQLIVRQNSNLHRASNHKAYFPHDEANIIYRATSSPIEFWRGIFHSVRPSPQKMILTIDTCMAAMYRSGSLLDACMHWLNFKNARELDLSVNDASYKLLETYLKKIEITVQTTGRRPRGRKIRSLVTRAGYVPFEKNGIQTTVKDYFREVYGVNIRYPGIIGVNLAGRQSIRQEVVPIELCHVTEGQFYKRKVPDDLMAGAVTAFARANRWDTIQKAVQAYNQSEFVQESGMKINTSPLEVKARRLRHPSVEYNNKLEIRDGSWNLRGLKFNIPEKLHHWAVVNFSPDKLDPQMINNKLEALRFCCEKLGIETKPPMAIHASSGNSDQVEADLKKTMWNLRPNAGEIRNKVKHLSDVKIGFITQCLRLDKVLNAQDQYWNNVAMKLNARLGGSNSHASTSPVMLELQTQPYMIIGADVGHPGPGVLKPSVAALVWSHDRHAVKYGTTTRIQAPRLEIIEDLQAMVEEAINNFSLVNKLKQPPRKIVFFRDGVSEGEYDKVVALEIKAIKDAIKANVEKTGGQTALTFIVVGKRHHSVFFPLQGDRKGNCLSGSVIDSQVTNTTRNDFYLQSHAAIQGTPRSARYIVLLDEIFNSDLRRIQDLAFTLCHLYAKATRSVSIPAPVYYADLVCARGVFHMDPNSNGPQIDNGPFDLSAWTFQPVHRNVEQRMYFL